MHNVGMIYGYAEMLRQGLEPRDKGAAVADPDLRRLFPRPVGVFAPRYPASIRALTGRRKDR
jgi:hypothetical protein